MLHNLCVMRRGYTPDTLRLSRVASAASLGKDGPCEFFNAVHLGEQFAWAHCTGSDAERDADFAMFCDLVALNRA